MDAPIASIWNEIIIGFWIAMVELFWLHSGFPCGAIWFGSPWVELFIMESVKTDPFGDRTIVVICDDVHHLVIMLTSASQLSWSLSVLVLYLSSVNRGADN